MTTDETILEALGPLSEIPQLDRRELLKLLGGGIVVFFTAGPPAVLAQARPGQGEYPEDFNAYLRIGEDGRVTCFTGKIEMGQGISTSLAQMLAEELEVPLSAVDMVMGDTALCPWAFLTVGSRSTKVFGPVLRRAAAEARAVLLELAAAELGVAPERLVVADGEIRDRQQPGKSVTYAQLAKGKRIDRHVTGEIPLKQRARHAVCGRDAARLDAEPKVTGEAKFTGDVRLPGMLYAAILRPPAHGATLGSVEVSAAEKIDGARVVRDGDLVAVLHQAPDVAAEALRRVSARYDVPEPKVDHDSIFEHLTQAAPPAETVAERGSLESGRALAEKSFEATYLNHYVAHAPIETHTAAAHVEGDRATVWASCQGPFLVRDSVAQTLGLDPAKVRVITPFVGGGFGGKTAHLQALEAARLSRLAGRPVMVAWTRQEEFFYDTFRPAAVIKLRSGINAAKKIAYWDYDNFFAGSRSSEPVYDIAHLRVLERGGWRGGGVHPFNVGAWRGPGSNTNVFAMESHVDLMAEAAGLDPLSFRLGNLSNDRMRRVLEAAARQFGRSFSTAPSGRGYGIVCTDYLDSYVAAAAEVKVDTATGRIRVERVVCAQDMGEVINPRGARLQIEGCITMGLGYVLSEEIRFQGGKILDTNFDTYEIPRFSWLPEIEIVLIENRELPPQGCGEPAITAMGGLIANAVYDAIGVRMFELPMTPARIMRTTTGPNPAHANASRISSVRR